MDVLDASTAGNGLDRTDPVGAAKPVRIVTIGFGADADASALKQISDVTHGQRYIVKDPKDIHGVVLDSVIANN